MAVHFLVPWITAVLFGIFIAPAVLRFVWNMTMPDLFDMPEVGHWEAFRLIVIGALLFGGFSFGLAG